MNRPTYGIRRFKRSCAACGVAGRDMNKEHYWPRWLIERTGTDQENSIDWMGEKRVSALSATLPLCVDCNSAFGRELEAPMARIFDDIEAGRGLSDQEAEIAVRWMWKFEGLAWMFHHPSHIYTRRYTLRDRVLMPLDDIRGKLTLAIGLAEQRDPEFKDGAMGIDSNNLSNAIFVSGVFSRTAILISLSAFDDQVPAVLSKYHLSPHRNEETANAKLFYPAVGFPTCTAAIGMMRTISPALSHLHDEYGARDMISRTAFSRLS
jgi:hypothetical protein